MIGKTVSHYEIVEPLGAGGMGVVYKARDTKLERFVALKFLPTQFGLTAEMKKRFVNEARAASALDHANICTIHEIDETDDGELFIVMGFYEGESLKERIARGPLRASEVIDFGLQAASGLAAAHEEGILHRDIKPANIFVTTRGQVKLLDFGLAKIADGTKLTQTGTAMGTLSYMPPELVRGEAVDQRADVWALGAVIYEMLTGRPAFGGDNEGSVIYAVLDHEPEAPSAVIPGIPVDFDRLIRRALAKVSAERYASVAQLRDDLVAIEAGAQRTDARAALLAPDDQPTLTHVDSSAVMPEVDNSVAVIDFTNITKDPSADWLSGGIAETLSVDLKKVSSLKVVGRQKIHQILGVEEVTALGEEQLQRIGRDLGARWVFWGAFQKLGDAIRITAHCLDVVAGRTVATIKLDGSVTDIFSLQDQIITSLMAALELEVTDSEVREIERPETRDLEAYEYCAKARQLVYAMTPAGLREARRYLEKAIELDPDYAMAYSSLGQLFCMRFITTTDREDLEEAIRFLQRAVDLDPDLADSHGWLTYSYSRERRYAEAIDSGRRAVELEPDNPMSHYLLAVALWLRGMDEYEIGGYREAVERLRQTTELAPRYQAGYQIMGGIYLSVGQYDRAATSLQHAAAIEAEGDWEMARFVGAIGLLGRVAFRQGRLEEAATLFEKSFRVSGEVEHIYTAACNALSHCFVGDLHLRRRRYDEAMYAFRRAQAQVAESPRSLGIGWPQLRALVGLAQSFHRLGMRREAESSHTEALSLLADKAGCDFSGIWQGGQAEIHVELACYLALSHRLEEAVAQLEKAVSCGWAETPRLENDPSLAPVIGSERCQKIRAALGARAPLP